MAASACVYQHVILCHTPHMLVGVMHAACVLCRDMQPAAAVQAMRDAGVKAEGNVTVVEVALGHWKYLFMVVLDQVQVSWGRPGQARPGGMQMRSAATGLSGSTMQRCAASNATSRVTCACSHNEHQCACSHTGCLSAWPPGARIHA